MNRIYPFFNKVNRSFLYLLIIFCASVVTGSVIAFFLTALDVVTLVRFRYTWLLFLLPPAGVFIWFIYQKWGAESKDGINLIFREIFHYQKGVPVLMTPVILFTTLLTHLFGGSAGREGVAVQIGGSVFSGCIDFFKNIRKRDKPLFLTAGIAAGFAAIFGTPLTGAIFAIEVLVTGKLKYKAFPACLIAAFIGDYACSFWGVSHTHYYINSFLLENEYFHFDTWTAIKIAFISIAFGLAALLFIRLTKAVQQLSLLINTTWLRPVAGGLLIIALAFIPGNENYLGLGVLAASHDSITLPSTFMAGGAESFSWLWKLLFTAITIGFGFKGGEVTPLFFIGAALGNTIAILTGMPVDLLAALGFIAIFAGATNTPLACIVMGAELFGSSHLPYYLIACLGAFLISSRESIYSAQMRKELL